MPMIPPDILRFIGATEEPHIVGWNGPWPPPVQMLLAVGPMSGRISIIDYERVDEAQTLVEQGIATVHIMTRGNHSVLDESRKNPNFTRAAEYHLDRVL